MAVLVSGHALIAAAFQEDASDLRDDQFIDLTIHSCQTKVPALQFRLFPNRVQMIDRNAAIFYHRAISESRAADAGIRNVNRQVKEGHSGEAIPNWDSENFELWTRSPINQMPVDDMRVWLEQYKNIFPELKRARLSKYCDWQISSDPQETDLNWLEMTMDEVQHMRTFCRILAVAIRVAAYDGDFEKAYEYLQTGFKIAHDCSNAETLVAPLVGIACQSIMADQMTMIMQQPLAPNVYWPLVDLPTPLTDVRAAIRYELEMLNGKNAMFKTLRDPESTTLTDEGWMEAIGKDIELFQNFGGNYVDATTSSSALIIRGYPIAKQSLLNRGFDAERVEAMPAAQVVLIHEKRATEIWCDEYLKLLNLPLLMMEPQMNDFESALDAKFYSPQLNSDSNLEQMPLLPFLSFSMPAFAQVIRAETRASTQIATLQVIEAIRAHAAETGQLPDQLSDISVLPVPNNPSNDKPFAYSIKEGKAELWAMTTMRSTWKIYRVKLAE